MNRFEDQLHKALSEPEPPAGLAGRVLERAALMKQGRRSWRAPLKVAAAIAVIAALAAAGVHYERRREERIASERARDQVVRAFQLVEERLKPFRKRLEAMQSIPISTPQGKDQK
jgi:hypothetical protein